MVFKSYEMKPVRIPRSKTNVGPIYIFPSNANLRDFGIPEQNRFVLSESLTFRYLSEVTLVLLCFFSPEVYEEELCFLFLFFFCFFVLFREREDREHTGVQGLEGEGERES